MPRRRDGLHGLCHRVSIGDVRGGYQPFAGFEVYEIDLARWFPGHPEDPRLPYDSNADGYLDSDDANWQTDEDSYLQGSISLARGSVFGEKFWIAVDMTQANPDLSIPTFQMQLLDTRGDVVKFWDVVLQDFESAGEDRTVVSLPNGVLGRTQISQVENLDTETCFSLVRNRLYTMGEKSQSQSYGEDVPVDLSVAGVLVLNANHEWQIQNSIFFN